jgi:hypothetical protein
LDHVIEIDVAKENRARRVTREGQLKTRCRNSTQTNVSGHGVQMQRATAIEQH